MKREADGEMGSPQKRSRRGDEEVRLLIPSKVAGSIIGKGGSNITKLRSQYKASITVPDCPGPERMLTLSSDLETICRIVSDVVPNLEESTRGSNVNELDLRMMIHQSQAGCVIGKSGYKIKEIREKTGARIKIFSNLAPQSTDRVIQIIGEPSKCVETIREVLTLIKSSPIKGVINPYDPHNYDDYYAEEYGGWGSSGAARRGASADMRPARNGVREPAPAPGAQRFSRPLAPRSATGGFLPQESSYTDRSNASMPRSSFSRPALNGNPPGYESNGWTGAVSNGNSYNRPPPTMMGGALAQGAMMGANGQGKNTTQVTIPKDLAGAIIGKGGGRIRKIRQDSGAGITIDEPLPGSNDRIITISGLPNQIQMAQYLLQQSVHNNADRNAY